ncbi:hypothetical protein EV194_11553 [Natronoflexus pectinivorans]|uniref:Uncharacterized protein n=1 Tax=Natronoflexus pectinivorans TaxID=682526 RepID=A0A4R2GE30_9BACT|nr:hypothetical protein EV194_11553 [Natronoflexus pectinivorans]
MHEFYHRWGTGVEACLCRFAWEELKFDEVSFVERGLYLI